MRHKTNTKFIDHKIKPEYRILIIFGTTILDTTCIKRLFKFPPHPKYAFALPGEIKTHEISVQINKKRQKPSVTLLIESDKVVIFGFRV